MVSCISTLSHWIDEFLEWLKWPVALVALLATPGAAVAFVVLTRKISSQPQPFVPFLIGAGCWLAVWWLFLRQSRFSLFLTIEHELTHALFAWLTLHRVTGIRVTLMRGGQLSLAGRGNWLITIAPYFWPTASLFMILLVWILPEPSDAIGEGFIGASFAWHLTSTLRETHGGQTDIIRVKRTFAWMFLPAANLVALGAVLSFAYGGTGELSEFFIAVGQRSVDCYSMVLDKLSVNAAK